MASDEAERLAAWLDEMTTFLVPPETIADPEIQARERVAHRNIPRIVAILRRPASPPAPELAKRLRDRAASLEDSDGMPSDTSLLLTEAANALEAKP